MVIICVCCFRYGKNDICLIFCGCLQIDERSLVRLIFSFVHNGQISQLGLHIMLFFTEDV